MWEDFDRQLEDLVLRREAEKAERAETQKRRAAAAGQCYSKLSGMVKPFFEHVADRMGSSNLERRIYVETLDHQGAVYMVISDLDGDTVGHQLICFCDVEQGVITLDICEIESFVFNFDIELSAAGKLYRQKAGQASYNYGAFSQEILEQKVFLYLEHFL